VLRSNAADMPETHRQLSVNDLLHPKQDCHAVDETKQQVDAMTISCLRSLAMDAVQKAGSGHPGTPMAMAPVGYALWARILNYDPQDPTWMNRDRFVLSMGHASMLLYGLLHLSGVREVEAKNGRKLAVDLDDIKAFRQIGSKCPGHPESTHTTGVEMTTGPLGQGVASSVGMAMASKFFAATFNRDGFELFGYDTYALCGDGCLMEGVAAEAASLAGHLKLDNLCWIWDNNHITIDGNTAWSTSEEIATRFIAYNWNVNRVGDANDIEALTRAFRAFKKEKERPTLIIVDSHIAWGSPSMQDHFKAHGTPLGVGEVKATKEIYKWPDKNFLVPDECTTHLRGLMEARGGQNCREWKELLSKYEKKHVKEGQQLRHMMNGTLPKDWDSNLKPFPPSAKGLATRVSSSTCLNQVARTLPWMMGGSADLAHSCLTELDFEGAGNFMPPNTQWGNYSGRNIHFGIREHAMGSIMNGLSLCGLRPFGSTFLVFSDYMKPSLRMSACMNLPCIFIFTHDSINVGEDGPTHQPVEQISALRSIPNMLVFRPCDANETMEMWKHLVTLQEEPAAVVLSRQDLATLDREKYASAAGVHKGAYIIAGPPDEEPDIILMSSGSEVHLMLEVHEVLRAEGVKVRSLSIPSIGLFKMQPDEYIQKLLPNSCRKRVSIEAGRRDQWASLVGLDGQHIGMRSFGISGPNKQVQKEFGFTQEHIVGVARRVLTGATNSNASRATDPPRKRRRVETFE